tara:strand:- start:33 stop:1721 length:1689 start_codon:yes stop_codon:yes gene_type:complete
MSTINVTNLSGRNGSPNLPDGAVVTGVVTSTTFDGNLKSTGTPTLGLGVTINSSGVNVSGVLTATSLYGDGSNLTGVGESIAPHYYNPDVNDSSVTTETGIGITFNKKIEAGSGTATIKIVNAGAAGTTIQSWGVSSATYNVTQFSLDSLVSPLVVNQTYQVDIPSGFLVDSNETSYVGTAYTFTVESAQVKGFIWGVNNDGGLGQNQGPSQLANASSPIQIPSAKGNDWNYLESFGSSDTSNGTKTDGTLWSWGNNGMGQLGQDVPHGTNISSPAQIPGTTWSAVGNAGRNNVYHTKTDGTLWSWGYNGSGHLGLNDRTQRSSPAQVGSDTTWAKTQTGQYTLIGAGRDAFGTIKTDGTLWTCGAGGPGMLANNNRISLSSPVQVPGTTWRNISAGMRNMHACKTDGTLWAWGVNSTGELGQNDVANRSSPVQIPGTTWKYVTSCGYGNGATKTDGTLWTWGNNEHGRLGLNENDVHRSSPTQVPGTTWDRIGSIRRAMYATKTDGTLWTMGYNYYGQLGQNSAENNISSPVQIGSETDWSNIQSSHYANTMTGLRTDETP